MSRVLVVGLPRSGTSWTGRVVGRADGAVFVHEPDGDHEPYAIRAKRGHGRHILLQPNEELEEFECLWAGAFAGGDRHSSLRARAAERLFETAALAQRTAARRGEPIPIRLRAALALAIPPGSVPAAQHVVVKSVHASLCLEWITHRFDPKVLIIERDPRNALASWMDLGMGGDRRENIALAAFAQQTWGLDMPPNDAPKVVQRTFIYGILASALRAASQRNPHWIVASHEELCAAPELRFAALLHQLGLSYGEAAAEYLHASDRTGAGFRTQRVTKDEPDKWRTRLSAEDAELIEAELARFPFQLIRDKTE